VFRQHFVCNPTRHGAGSVDQSTANKDDEHVVGWVLCNQTANSILQFLTDPLHRERIRRLLRTHAGTAGVVAGLATLGFLGAFGGIWSFAMKDTNFATDDSCAGDIFFNSATASDPSFDSMTHA
jgi:hypothetical protein